MMEVATRPDLAYTPVPGLWLPWASGADLADLAPTEERWLVHGLIPAETINLLVGNPGAGKSLLALDLCGAVATGRSFLGRETRAGTVMYVAAEDGVNRLATRLRHWLDGAGADAAELNDRFYILPQPLSFAAGEAYADQAQSIQQMWEHFELDVRQIDPVLIVLDPLVELHQGLDENKSTEMAPLIATLRRLVRGHDRALIVTHHDRKGSEPGVYAARGSGAIAGGMDGQYHLVAVKPADEDQDERLRAVLHVTKGRDLPPALKKPIGLRFDRGRWVHDESARTDGRERQLEPLRRCYDFLIGVQRAVGIQETREALGVAYNTARGYLDTLVQHDAALLTEERPARYLAKPGARARIC